jgi:hypothetical protein
MITAGAAFDDFDARLVDTAAGRRRTRSAEARPQYPR